MSEDFKESKCKVIFLTLTPTLPTLPSPSSLAPFPHETKTINNIGWTTEMKSESETGLMMIFLMTALFAKVSQFNTLPSCCFLDCFVTISNSVTL